MNPFSLALLRVTRGKGPLSVVIGIISIIQFSVFALGFVLPKVEAQSTEYAISKIDGKDRWLTVSQANGSELSSPELFAKIANEFESVSKSNLNRSITYRPISDDFAGRFQLVGTDQIEKDFRLIDGNYPKNCSTNLCEVIAVNPANLTKLPEGLKVVGTGELNTDSPLVPTIEEGTTLLVSNNSSEIIKFEFVNGFPTTELWSVEISNAEIQKVGLENYLSLIRNLSSNLNQISSDLLISGPISQLETTQSQISVLFNRIYSLIFSLCLVSFIAIFFITSSAKSGNEKFINSVKRISIKPYSYYQFSNWMAAVVVGIGTSIGFLLAAILQLVISQRLNFGSLNLILPLFNLVFTFLIILIALIKQNRIRSVSSLVFVLLLSVFINISTIDYKFSLIPIIGLGVALIVNNLFLGQIKNKFNQNTYLSNKSFFMALGIIASLFVSIITSAVYYLNALNLNAQDNAIFQSPTTLRITSGGEAQPMQNNSFQNYEKLSGGSAIFGVRKVSALYPENLITSVPIQLVGVDPQVWNYVPEITHQTGLDLTKTALFMETGETELGISAPGNSTLTIEVSGLNSNTSLGVWTLNDRGESLLVALEENTSNFEAKLPINTVSLIGFQVTELPDFKARREHAVGEGKNSLPAPQGVLSLSELRLDSELTEFKEIKDFSYSLLNGPVYFSQVNSPANIPAIVDQQTAKVLNGNVFQLKISNDVFISLNKVETANLLPTVPMRFALVNPDLLAQFLAANSPELLRTSEVWITDNFQSSPDLESALFGLTVLNQNDLILKNQSPTNAKWSQNSLIFTMIIAIFLYSLMVYALIFEITRNPQFIGWNSSGFSFSKIRNQLTKTLFGYLVFSGVLGILISVIGIRMYLQRVAYDINGNLAYPPLVVKENPAVILSVGLVFAVISLLIIFSSLRKLKVSSASDEN